MLARTAALAILTLLTTGSAFANTIGRGDVLLENLRAMPGGGASYTSHDLWWWRSAWGGAVSTGFNAMLHKFVPFTGPGRFLVPAPNQFVFHHERTVSMWDGMARDYREAGKGYTEIFTSDAELSEIAPMRSGNFLVAQRSNDRARGAALIEFNARGVVAQYRFPELITVDHNRAAGAAHIELLSDQCTLLYTLGADHPTGNRVGRLNICTREPQRDFATLAPGLYAGSIRQLPNGDVLVANGDRVQHFTPSGTVLRTYYVPAVTHLALSVDGTSFFASGVEPEQSYLWRFDLDAPNSQPVRIPLNGGGYGLTILVETSDLVTVGEWRASAAATKRLRSARH